jgi:hypothetical protein
MARICGSEMTKHDILRRVGRNDAVCGAKRVILADGPARELPATFVRTGSGFEFTVLEGRGLDISWAGYNGVPLCYRSTVGDRHAAHHEYAGMGFLRSFYGGLLTTCGLTQVGAPCVDGGQELGLHGRFTATPAEQVCVREEWDGDEYVIRISGRIVESGCMKGCIACAREITTRLGAAELEITDVVTNEGFETMPHMILYHVNPGWPVVSSTSRLIAPIAKTSPNDDHSAKYVGECTRFVDPQDRFPEQNFQHTMKPGADGYVTVALVNEEFNGGVFGLWMRYRFAELPHFNQWKKLEAGTYVVGIEPGNCICQGRVRERELGTLRHLEPGQRVEYKLTLGVVHSRDQLAAL